MMIIIMIIMIMIMIMIMIIIIDKHCKLPYILARSSPG